MKKTLFILVLGIGAVLISCSKEEETIKTYIYAQDLEEGETASLFIDGNFETELGEAEVTPSLENETTLTECYVMELPHGKHHFRLETKSQENISSGHIKFKPNRFETSAGHGDQGEMRGAVDQRQKRMLIGLIGNSTGEHELNNGSEMGCNK